MFQVLSFERAVLKLQRLIASNRQYDITKSVGFRECGRGGVQIQPGHASRLIRVSKKGNCVSRRGCNEQWRVAKETKDLRNLQKEKPGKCPRLISQVNRTQGSRRATPRGFETIEVKTGRRKNILVNSNKLKPLSTPSPGQEHLGPRKERLNDLRSA